MAHQLNFNTAHNDYSFFSVKERAWHGLGKIVNEYPTSAEAIKFAGLDYTVEKWPMFAYDPDGITTDERHVPDRFATVRTDNFDVLGTVGKDYEIVQNTDAFTFFDAIVNGEGILYETAGALGKGERIFITAKLPGYIRVGKDDLIEKYLFLTTSHDGFGSITAAFTPIRIVCNNTLNGAMRNHTDAVKIRHTASAGERLREAHKLMGISNTMADNLNEIFNHWAQVRVTDKEVKKLIQVAMVPNKETLHNLLSGQTDELSSYYTNMVDKVYEYAMSSPSQQMDTTAGTLFGTYNAVTGYFQNVRNYKEWLERLFGKSKQIGEGLSIDRNKTSTSLNEKLEVLIPAGKIASLNSGEMVGVIAADAQEKFTGQFETSAVNCRINLDMKEIGREEKAYRPLPSYYDFGGNKEEKLRQNFNRISQEIQEMVLAFMPSAPATTAKATMKNNGK